jgi:hypothetical protein
MRALKQRPGLLALALVSCALIACSDNAEEGPAAGPDGGGDIAADAAGTPDGGEITSDAADDSQPEFDSPVSDIMSDGPEDVITPPDMIEPDTGSDVQTAIIRWFAPEPTGLGQDFVFKGGWAGETGRIIAVGNDGVVASRDPEGDWQVLNQGSGADLLNDVDGSGPTHIWAVGKKGAMLTGSVDELGEQKPCEDDAQCENGDPCSSGTCAAGICVFTILETAQCCGTQIQAWNFDDGTAMGFLAANSSGGLQWHVTDHHSASPPNSLYFGSEKKTPPDFDTGEIVVGSMLSPPFTLPTVGSASLSFMAYMDTEASGQYDQFSVSVDFGGTSIEVWSKAEIGPIPTPGFVEASADLSNWLGKSIRVRFHFDSIDSLINYGEGVLIDDVSIESSCEGAEVVNSGWPTLFAVEVVSPGEAYAVGLGGQILEYDGQVWREPKGLDTNITWNGLYGDADTLVLVGNDGHISVTEGGKLENVESPTSATLRDVHSVDGQSWWAVGDSGTLLKGTGTSWSVVGSPTVSDLHGVYAASSDNVYAVGAQGTVIHYDGLAWSTVDGVPQVLSAATFRSIYVDQTGKATVVGDGGILAEGTFDGGFIYAGALTENGALMDIWGMEGARFIVGDNSEIFSHAGTWETLETPTTQHLRSISGVAIDDVWAVGWASVLLHWDGLAWEQYMTPMTGQLEAVYARATDDVYAVGSGGAILQWNGAQWSILASETAMNLRDIFVFPGGDKWAVGAEATIMRHSGLAWHQTPLPPKVYADGTEELITDELHAIWGATPDDVWAVGANGRTVHWDGQKWNLIDSNFPITLRGLYGLAADDMWAVGNEGTILHFDGDAWTPWSSGSVATFYEIDGDGEDHVVIVGDLGSIYTLRSEEIEIEDE